LLKSREKERGKRKKGTATGHLKTPKGRKKKKAAAHPIFPNPNATTREKKGRKEKSTTCPLFRVTAGKKKGQSWGETEGGRGAVLYFLN